MPNGDGKGPYWGNNQQNTNAGPGGYCVCPKCGTKTGHVRGMPCANLTCSNCGTKMVRQ